VAGLCEAIVTPLRARLVRVSEPVDDAAHTGIRECSEKDAGASFPSLSREGATEGLQGACNWG
jgi:hypothetical protein